MAQIVKHTTQPSHSAPEPDPLPVAGLEGALGAQEAVTNILDIVYECHFCIIRHSETDAAIVPMT